MWDYTEKSEYSVCSSGDGKILLEHKRHCLTEATSTLLIMINCASHLTWVVVHLPVSVGWTQGHSSASETVVHAHLTFSWK